MGTKDTTKEQVVWVHGNPLAVPSGTWPSGLTPRAVLRFAGPVQPAWRTALRRAGLRIRFYCPPAGVCVDLPAVYRQTPDKLVGLSFVVAGRDYDDALCQRFGTTGQPIQQSPLPGDMFDLICFDRRALPSIKRHLAKLRAHLLQSANCKLRVSYAGDIGDLQAIAGVKLADRVRLPTLLSITALRLSLGLPASLPAAWGLDGAGEVIAIADTGLDSGDPSAGMHPDFSGRLRALLALPTNPSWAAFAATQGDDAADRASGHGTHVAGLAAGSGAASHGEHSGLAPASELVFLALEQKIEVTAAHAGSLPSGYYLAGRPIDLRDLYRQAASYGAKLHNISWGDAAQGAYTDDSFETDLFLNEDPAAIIVCAAGNDGVDRDGNRHIDTGSLYSPASAKNAIAVGATEGPLSGCGSRATWGQLDTGAKRWPVLADRNDPVSGEADRIAPFSSCGPTRDGRLKPDLCAPGTNLVATRSRRTPYQGWGLADPMPFYMYDGGTSTAAPLVTGALALIRQAWRRERRLLSGAALKALLLLAAQPVRGRGTGNALPAECGFGRLDIGRALPPAFAATPGWQVTVRDAASQRLETGQQRASVLRLAGNCRLRAVLCWYDPAGERLINDLALSLLGPDGQLIATGGVPGASPEHCNPLACIDLPLLAKGRYLLRVSGSNVMDGPQRYALVWAVDTTAH